MDDTISRQAAIDALGEEPLVWNEDDVGEVAERNQWKQDVAAIKALPSAERHGRWIRTHNPIGQEITVCSVCGKIKQQAYPNYCGNCGAQMEVE